MSEQGFDRSAKGAALRTRSERKAARVASSAKAGRCDGLDSSSLSAPPAERSGASAENALHVSAKGAAKGAASGAHRRQGSTWRCASAPGAGRATVRPSRPRERPGLACRAGRRAPPAMSTLRGGATARGASPVKRSAPAAASPAVYVLDDELANSLLGAPPPPRAPRPAGDAGALDATQVRAAPPCSPRRASRAPLWRRSRHSRVDCPSLTRPRRSAAPVPPHAVATSPLPEILTPFCAALRRVLPRCRTRFAASAAAVPPRPRGPTARRRRARPTWAAGGRWRRRTRSTRSAKTHSDERRSCGPPKKTLDRRTTTQTGAKQHGCAS
jgi:hypothetical protein